MVEIPMWGLVAVGVASFVIGVVVGVVVIAVGASSAVGRGLNW